MELFQSEITTTNNPYTIETNEGGVYNLISFSDAVEQGGLSGQAFVTIQDAPCSTASEKLIRL